MATQSKQTQLPEMQSSQRQTTKNKATPATPNQQTPTNNHKCKKISCTPQQSLSL
ncbi:MAG: hypothetical protein NWE93_10310 [Candidatus Bathyarchaeota archaeon]|nr:hypothetical protein [Candidatus Bathyarchaeota archaeon]